MLPPNISPGREEEQSKQPETKTEGDPAGQEKKKEAKKTVKISSKVSVTVWCSGVKQREGGPVLEM